GDGRSAELGGRSAELEGRNDGHDDDDRTSRGGGGASHDKAESNGEMAGASHDKTEASREKGGASREEVLTSREKVELSREEVRMSHEIPGKEANPVRNGREKDGPGPEIPALIIDKRIRGQEEEWEGEDIPEPQPDEKPARAPAIGGALDREPAVKAVFEDWRGGTGHGGAKMNREGEVKNRGRPAEGDTGEQMEKEGEGGPGSPLRPGD